MDEQREFRQDLFRRVASWTVPRHIGVEWIRVSGIDERGDVVIELGHGMPPHGKVTGLVWMDARTGTLNERC